MRHNRKGQIVENLQEHFRGGVLRSVQANGLALVDQHWKCGESLPMHRHDNAWFTFIFAGSYVERLSNSERSCSAGTVIWHPHDLRHANCFLSDGHNLNLVLAYERLASLPSDVSIRDKEVLWKGGLPYSFGLELYRSLNHHAQIPEESVVNLISFCASSAHAHKQVPWLARILDWMNDEYSAPLTLMQASEQAGVHPVHVSRSFRNKLGCTFREHLRRTRVSRAIDLLKRSRADITDVALACGFSDHAHFTRTFKQVTGLTPTSYRTQAG
jgi:AraC family transcriptional regulator